MAIHKLSSQEVKNAGPGKHEDGGGLRLVVSKNGSKKWVLRYTLKGKRREMGIGSITDTTLAKARKKAIDIRELVSDGIDPIQQRKVEEEKIPTFTTCAARYIKAHRRGWKNAKHKKQWTRTLKTYVRDEIGDNLVDSITTDQIVKILTPIWTTKTETAKRVQGRIENILDYAAAHKYKDSTNPARWRGHLDKLLPKPSRVKTVKHHPAMPYHEVPGLMKELSDKPSMSSYALRFLILTATRTSETLQAEWEEIDLEQKIWTIPASRMKARQEHRVPLPSKAIMILNAIPRIDENPYVFTGHNHGKPLSNMALLKMMRDLGYTGNPDQNDKKPKYVPHGFRSSFRDWSGEESHFPRDVAEMALAHTIENKVEAAYRRGDLFEKRRLMMQEWAIFCSQDYVKRNCI